MVSGRSKIQAGYRLTGLCYADGLLVAGEWRLSESRRNSHSLAAYQVQTDSGNITLLDRVELRTGLWRSLCPCVERHSRRLFVPCEEHGVTVARLEGDRFVMEKTLTCVKNARSVDVMSLNIVYVCDHHSHNVHVVEVRDDRILSTLEKPDKGRNQWPLRLAVLGDRVMVACTGRTLVLYHHGSPAPVRVIPWPGRLKDMTAVSTDCHSYFVITDADTKSLFTMDVSGNFHHTVDSDTDSGTEYTLDSAVVSRQVWVGCRNGDIVIMSSQ